MVWKLNELIFRAGLKFNYLTAENAENAEVLLVNVNGEMVNGTFAPFGWF